jgi:hypothetical protein
LSLNNFREFISAIEGKLIAIQDKNVPGLVQVFEEFNSSHNCGLIAWSQLKRNRQGFSGQERGANQLFLVSRNRNLVVGQVKHWLTHGAADDGHDDMDASGVFEVLASSD